MYYELKKSNLKVEKQKPLPLIYEEVKLDVGYRIDIIIEDKFIIEIKAVEALRRYEAQLFGEVQDICLPPEEPKDEEAKSSR